MEEGWKRATTAVPAELGAPTCNYRNRHGETLTVPRGLGLLAKLRRREMKRKATTALAAMGPNRSEGRAPAVPALLWHSNHLTVGQKKGWLYPLPMDENGRIMQIAQRVPSTPPGFHNADVNELGSVLDLAGLSSQSLTPNQGRNTNEHRHIPVH